MAHEVERLDCYVMAPKRNKIRTDEDRTAEIQNGGSHLFHVSHDAVLQIARLIGRQIAREHIAHLRAEKNRAEVKRRVD